MKGWHTAAQSSSSWLMQRTYFLLWREKKVHKVKVLLFLSFSVFCEWSDRLQVKAPEYQLYLCMRICSTQRAGTFRRFSVRVFHVIVSLSG